MKFAKQLEMRKVRDWSPYYLNYRGLKKLLGQIKSQQQESTPNASTSIPHLQETFWYLLEQEIDKIERFFIESFRKYSTRFQALIAKYHLVRNALPNPEFATELAKFRNAVHLLFHNYLPLNKTGIIKIVKKHDKIMNITTLPTIIQTVKTERRFWKQGVAELENLVNQARQLQWEVNKKNWRHETDAVP